MYWLAKEDFARTVPLTWHRTAQDESGHPAEEERVVVKEATWRQKGRLHALTFALPNDAETGVSGTLVLRVEPEAVMLTRFGDVTWNHTFAAGLTFSSTLRMGELWLDVVSDTETVDVEIHPHGGTVRVAYRMTIGDVAQQVALSLQFGDNAVNG
ncbi:hypothetical protein GCM10025857_21840 [Alicyclobacillus contaminans]|uniref:DUF1934 family protein n=1 Tax=Alicyclobacillus contaminans TaxID=392016 RepID=UPI0003FE1362|nr:DUF1934 family protein [Alicyclobacillus contaminans]GMA50827.1 hypothetical protein GCM10025857_21840 [Alicyclobacillus contaminans]